MGFLYYLLLGTLMIFVLVVTCVVKIKENERGVKFRSGEFKCVMEPGIYVVIPVLENYRCIEISSKTYPLLHDEFITKDNVKVKVETTFTFNVFASLFMFN